MKEQGPVILPKNVLDELESVRRYTRAKGSDTLIGGDDNDGVYGGVGDDGELVGGGGTDDISGGWGDDLIRSRDGVEGNDFVSCGPNEDTAFVDPEDKVAPGCEHVNPF